MIIRENWMKTAALDLRAAVFALPKKQFDN